MSLRGGRLEEGRRQQAIRAEASSATAPSANSRGFRRTSIGSLGYPAGTCAYCFFPRSASCIFRHRCTTSEDGRSSLIPLRATCVYSHSLYPRASTRTPLTNVHRGSQWSSCPVVVAGVQAYALGRTLSPDALSASALGAPPCGAQIRPNRFSCSAWAAIG